MKVNLWLPSEDSQSVSLSHLIQGFEASPYLQIGGELTFELPREFEGRYVRREGKYVSNETLTFVVKKINDGVSVDNFQETSSVQVFLGLIDGSQNKMEKFFVFRRHVETLKRLMTIPLNASGHSQFSADTYEYLRRLKCENYADVVNRPHDLFNKEMLQEIEGVICQEWPEIKMTHALR